MTLQRINALILALATLAFGLAPILGPSFRGYDPGLLPVRIERPAIQPAGYAFSIWGVIYLWLFLHAALGLLRRAEVADWDRIRWPLTVAVAIGVLWQAIALQSVIWGTVTIWIMAAAALAAFLRAPTEPDRWLLSAPLAIFAGWLTAAAAVSTGVLIAGYGLLSNTASALVMLALVLVIALGVQARKSGMPVYGLTVVWALGGVIAANLAETPLVSVAAAAGIAVMLGELAWLMRKL